MSPSLPASPVTDPRATATTDPVVALLVATAVGFVEAGLGTTAVARLHDLASGDVGVLEEALAVAPTWPSVSTETRDAAAVLLSVAAGR